MNKRLTSIDLLRGIVMLLMCIDHTRDYTHYHPLDPMDITHTPMQVFVLRILAHFCAPTFVLLAGVSAYMVGKRKNTHQLASFLLKRGLVLILLELTLINWSWSFNPLYHLTYLQVIWAIGVSMIALSGLIYLPKKYILGLSIGIFVLHPAVNELTWHNGLMHYLWSFLLQKNVIDIGGHMFRTTYPVLPIIGIMAGGYCLGEVFFKPEKYIKTILLKLGLSMLTLGLILRFVGYGDPSSVSLHNPAPLLMQVLNVTKYPISLHFALLFIGASLVVLSLLQGKEFSRQNPLLIFGQTPMFFYLLHIYLIHSIVLLYALFKGETPNLTDHLGGIAPNFGISMGQMYFVVLVVLAILLPFCKWYRSVKSSKKFPILQYL